MPRGTTDRCDELDSKAPSCVPIIGEVYLRKDYLNQLCCFAERSSWNWTNETLLLKFYSEIWFVKVV